MIVIMVFYQVIHWGMNSDPVLLFNKSRISIVISSNNAIFNCEFETGILKYDDPPRYSTPTHRKAAFMFTNSCPRLREQLVLKDLFDIVYGKYDLDCDLNNGINKKFYENGYCYSPVAPAPTSQIIIILNDSSSEIPRIDTGLHENDILKGVYDAVWDENNIINGISSGMRLFFLKLLSVVLFEIV